ncbi:uncharacterized SAM-binding protein YcdF (DUF218 family) [Litorimonas taeanensis]|uniref:Uncharacterized SAM-binding protein YcdF (DUF218 family) n=2 Tax=Litorimonas taeanensis TaxID=568099 RepID=A0A420WCZ1_9PROT|nr:uncharacterized SAM-binding protein YcdF (DUF218 family) [Litorimonas taeanensis]
MGHSKQAKKKRGWLKFFALLLGVILLILVAGFIAFADRVDSMRAPRDVAKADGIVVWTGPGGGRLEAAAELLKAGKGERLLISGVNTDLTSETVLNLLDIDADIKNCCVDLDYAAEDTIGNARETAIWAKALGYDHILLVTSAYHMPRAQSEIAVATGRIRITAYPVRASEDLNWYSDKARFKRLLNEYAKLILTMLRGTNTRVRESAPDVPLPEKSDTP